MLKLYIQGMQDGKKEFTLSTAIQETGFDFPEFIGLVKVKCLVRKLGSQFTIETTAECEAMLTCDISFEEFVETIRCDFVLSVKSDSNNQIDKEKIENDNIYEIHIGADDKEIDITQITLEELTVNLPMKRIAPAYRGKTFKDIHPEFSAESNKLNTDDERWSKLKNLKFN